MGIKNREKINPSALRASPPRGDLGLLSKFLRKPFSPLGGDAFLSGVEGGRGGQLQILTFASKQFFT